MEHLEVQTLDETLRGHHQVKGLHTERSVVRNLGSQPGSWCDLSQCLPSYVTSPSVTICSLLGEQTHNWYQMLPLCHNLPIYFSNSDLSPEPQTPVSSIYSVSSWGSNEVK